MASQLAIANDIAPGVAEERDQILAGLTAPQKRIDPKYLYDQRGSELFDRICTLPEYYPTRTELGLMRRYGDDIAALVGPRAAIIELGAGSSMKVRLLLDHLVEPIAYVPVDISGDYLHEQSAEFAADYPHVRVQPVFADFTRPFTLPSHPVTPERNLVFFPGSTIGNFSRQKAQELLAVMGTVAKPGGALLIGVDLRKDADILRAAYNDRQGVTAEFNLNVLARLNRELGADFRLDRFEHRAVYDEAQGRVEMRLVSSCAQRVRIDGTALTFERGEYIVTEHSHKYSLGEFRELARRAGLEPRRSWVDRAELFSLQYLVVP